MLVPLLAFSLVACSASSSARLDADLQADLAGRAEQFFTYRAQMLINDPPAADAVSVTALVEEGSPAAVHLAAVREQHPTRRAQLVADNAGFASASTVVTAVNLVDRTDDMITLTVNERTQLSLATVAPGEPEHTEYSTDYNIVFTTAGAQGDNAPWVIRDIAFVNEPGVPPLTHPTVSDVSS